MRVLARRLAIALGAVAAPVFLLVVWTLLRWFPVGYPSEPVSITSGGIRLSGTLYKPADDGVFPAVIVLHGSGAESRSEPTYRIQARAMLDHGFAALIYDKRGTAESEGELGTATYEDFAGDASAAVRYLAAREDIDGQAIGLFTNSESGWFAPQVAVETGSVRFIINRVGPPLPWVDTVSFEARNDFRAAGIAEQDLDALIAVTLWRWSYYRAAAGNPALASGPQREAVNAEMARVYATVPGAEEVMYDSVADYDPGYYRMMAARSAYDPGAWLRRLDIPLYYVFAGRDINVPTADSVAYLESLRADYPAQIAVHVYPELGHSLFTWTGLLTAGYPPDFLQRVGSWAESQLDH